MIQVQVTGGTIRGIASDGVVRFLGVPYAAPPVGEHRLQPPSPVVPWDGIRDALEFGATSPKGDYAPAVRRFFDEPVVAGDEWLNLNVWAPVSAIGAADLPVLVWIHGGAFTNGSGAVTAYDGTAFARDGVVTVTINYRLGTDGFLFTTGDRGAGTANLGLQDMVAALRWVQENISQFGGHPSRVTVAGESAGAMSISALLAMPTARGLFSQAIMQSGAASSTLEADIGIRLSALLANLLGVEPTREAIAAADLGAVVTAASELFGEVQASPDPGGWGHLLLSQLPFAPVVDGLVLPAEPLAAIEAGVSREVRVLVGSNAQEARLFLVASGLIDQVDEQMLAVTAAAYGLADEKLSAYRRADASPGHVLAQVITDWTFTIPAIRLAEAFERSGGTSWVYRFDAPDPSENDGLGAAHAVELAYVFGTIHLPEMRPLIGANPSRAVSDTAHGIWVRFVTHGDPGWRPYTTPTRTTGLISSTLDEIDDPDPATRKVWEGIR